MARQSERQAIGLKIQNAWVVAQSDAAMVTSTTWDGYNRNAEITGMILRLSAMETGNRRTCTLRNHYTENRADWMPDTLDAFLDTFADGYETEYDEMLTMNRCATCGCLYDDVCFVCEANSTRTETETETESPTIDPCATKAVKTAFMARVRDAYATDTDTDTVKEHEPMTPNQERQRNGQYYQPHWDTWAVMLFLSDGTTRKNSFFNDATLKRDVLNFCDDVTTSNTTVTRIDWRVIASDTGDYTDITHLTRSYVESMDSACDSGDDTETDDTYSHKQECGYCGAVFCAYGTPMYCSADCACYEDGEDCDETYVYDVCCECEATSTETETETGTAPVQETEHAVFIVSGTYDDVSEVGLYTRGVFRTRDAARIAYPDAIYIGDAVPASDTYTPEQRDFDRALHGVGYQKNVIIRHMVNG